MKVRLERFWWIFLRIVQGLNYVLSQTFFDKVVISILENSKKQIIMKACIKKKVIEGEKEVYEDILYNFPSFKEAQKRLLSIINNCKYPIINRSKNGFTCDKGFTTLVFKIVKK